MPEESQLASKAPSWLGHICMQLACQYQHPVASAAWATTTGLPGLAPGPTPVADLEL